MSGSPESAPRESTSEQAAHSWPYEIETFSNNSRRNEEIGGRKMAVDNQFSQPLNKDLLGEVDTRIIAALNPSLDTSESKPWSGEYIDKADSAAPAKKALNAQPEETEKEKAIIELSNELRGGGTDEPKSLDTVFANLETMARPEKKTRLNALLTFAEALRDQARAEKGDKILLRVAELTHLRAQMATAELFMQNEKYPDYQKQEVAHTYSAQFKDYAQTDDIPDRFKEQLEEAATALEKYAPAAPAAESVRGIGIDEEQLVPIRRVGSALSTPQPTELTIKSEETVSPEPVSTQLESEPGKKIFGREGGITPEDIQGVKDQLERLMAESSPKSAYETVKLLAHARQAGIRLTGGKEKMGQFFEQQREAMQKHGSRALAQYLTYMKYAGFLTGVSDSEQKLVMVGIESRKKDLRRAGITRLAANAHYLKIAGYTPDLVRADIIKEVQTLNNGGKLEEALTEAARARQAGINPQEAFVIPRDKNALQQELSGKLSDYAQDGYWENYARLRNTMEKIGGLGVFVQDSSSSEKMVDHFEQMRSRTQKNNEWDPYLSYAIDVQEISDRREAWVQEGAIQEAERQAKWETAREQRVARAQAATTPRVEDIRELKLEPREIDWNSIEEIERAAQALTEPVLAEAVPEANERAQVLAEYRQLVGGGPFAGVRRWWGRFFGGGQRPPLPNPEHDRILADLRRKTEKSNISEDEVQPPSIIDSAA